MSELKLDYFDDFNEGQVFEAFDSMMDETHVAALQNCINLHSVKDPSGVELPPVQEEASAVSPFLLNSFLPMRARVRMPDGLLHARETLHMHASAQAGETVRTRMSVKEKYEKNDRKFITFEHVVSRARDDAPIMSFQRTIAWVNP